MFLVILIPRGAHLEECKNSSVLESREDVVGCHRVCELMNTLQGLFLIYVNSSSNNTGIGENEREKKSTMKESLIW